MENLAWVFTTSTKTKKTHVAMRLENNRGCFVSSLLRPECSVHVRYKCVLAKVSMTCGKNLKDEELIYAGIESLLLYMLNILTPF